MLNLLALKNFVLREKETKGDGFCVRRAPSFLTDGLAGWLACWSVGHTMDGKEARGLSERTKGGRKERGKEERKE